MVPVIFEQVFEESKQLPIIPLSQVTITLERLLDSW